MAVEFKAKSLTRTSEYLIHPSDIKFKADLNGRHDLPNIEWLIESFMTHGQLEPVGIRNDGGIPTLAYGFSRWRAAVEINKRKLTPEPFKLRCVYFKGSEVQGFLAGLAENRARNATTAIDDGYAIARLERFGMQLDAMIPHFRPCDEMGTPLEEKKAVKWLKDRLALVNLSSASVEAVKNGTIKPSATKVLATLSEEQQAFALKQAKKNGTAITAASLKQKPTKAKTPPAEQVTIATPAHAEEPDDLKETESNWFRLFEIVQGISEGDPIPFEWEQSPVLARQFCNALLQHLDE